MTPPTVQQGIDVGAKNIGEYVNENYQLILEDHHNGLECRAHITVFDTDYSIPPAELITLLRNQHITDTIDLEQIAIFCSEAALGENPSNVLLAQGAEPVNGQDGWFELVITTGKEQTDRAEDDTARVDFKSIQAFSNIEKDQLIGNILPPTKGSPGKTIYSEVISPYPGKACPIRAGEGVHFNEDETQAFASRAGRILIGNNLLSVSEEFVVTGDVDFSIGHITFNGYVDIKGDVLDDFNITATKGINVNGAVGSCRITSEGPVSIGSMAGRGKGKIVCKGDFQARYLNHTTVECWGNAHISHEVRNTTLKATGTIMVPKGLITGGEIVALEGIEAKTLGARSATKTHLTAGIYFPEIDRLAYLRSHLKSLAEQLASITTTLTALDAKPLTNLRPALREAFQLRSGILTQRRVNLDEEREETTEELALFSLDDHPTANPKINVLDEIREGVIFHLGETSAEISTEIAGPASIMENTDEGGFQYLSYSPLESMPALEKPKP